MGFTSGFAAGEGTDALQEMIRQKAADAFEQQRISIQQQEAQQRMALQQAQLASLQDERQARQQAIAQDSAKGLAQSLGPGATLDDQGRQVLTAGNLGSLIQHVGPTLNSQNITGSLAAPGPQMLNGGSLSFANNPGQAAKDVFLGTDAQQQAQAAQQARGRFLAMHPEMADAINGLDPKEGGTAIIDYLKEQNKPTKPEKADTKPYYTRDPRTGALRYQSDIPANAMVAADAPPPQAHFQLVPGTGPDGKPAMFRVNTQTGDSAIVQPNGGSLGKPSGPGATTENRLQSAKAVVQTGNDIVAMLNDPKVMAQLGPAMSRANSVADFFGNPPPQFAKLAGMIESYSLANMGVHGMRSANGADAIRQTLGLTRHTPESMIATLQGLNGFANHLLENNNQSVTPTTPGTTKPSAADLLKKYGGG